MGGEKQIFSSGDVRYSLKGIVVGNAEMVAGGGVFPRQNHIADGFAQDFGRGFLRPFYGITPF